MRDLGGACVMNVMDGEGNESVHGIFSMITKEEGINCGVMDIVESSTLRWV